MATASGLVKTFSLSGTHDQDEKRIEDFAKQINASYECIKGDTAHESAILNVRICRETEFNFS